MTERPESYADSVDITPHDESLGANAQRAADSLPGNVIKLGRSVKDEFADPDAGSLLEDAGKFVLECAADVVSYVLDPVNFLVSVGLDFLVELIQPLQDMLHMVSGDGPSLAAAAGNFTKVGEGFVMLADDFDRTKADALKNWRGDAADAAKAGLNDFATGMQGVGSMAGAVAETLDGFSRVMVIAEETIKAIISEVVSFCISRWPAAMALAPLTAGGSIAIAMSDTIVRVTSAFSRITARMGKLGKLLDKLMEWLVKLPIRARANRFLGKPVPTKPFVQGGLEAAKQGLGHVMGDGDTGQERTGHEQAPGEARENLDIGGSGD